MVSSCCDPLEEIQTGICPQDGTRGHAVSLITLKSLLKPIRVGRCGCEVNHPQSRCCLTRIRSLIDDG